MLIEGKGSLPIVKAIIGRGVNTFMLTDTVTVDLARLADFLLDGLQVCNSCLRLQNISHVGNRCTICSC
jgi:hypothetical protein